MSRGNRLKTIPPAHFLRITLGQTLFSASAGQPRQGQCRPPAMPPCDYSFKGRGRNSKTKTPQGAGLFGVATAHILPAPGAGQAEKPDHPFRAAPIRAFRRRRLRQSRKPALRRLFLVRRGGAMPQRMENADDVRAGPYGRGVPSLAIQTKTADRLTGGVGHGSLRDARRLSTPKHVHCKIAHSSESPRKGKSPAYPPQPHSLMGFPKGVTPFGRRRRILLSDNFRMNFL